MSFSPLQVTNAGLNAIAQVNGAGATLLVTKVEAGSGFPAGGDVTANFTALKAYVMDCSSTSTNTLVLYQTTIRADILSSNAPKVFQCNELGVFASLNNGTPFLYAYSSTGQANGDTIDPGAPIVKNYVLPVVYSTSVPVGTTISFTDVVGLHAQTHLPSGVDPLPISGSSIGGLCPKTPNDATKVLLGAGTAAFGPVPLHAPTHTGTGTDPLPLSTTAASGALRALSGDPSTVLQGTGQWAAGRLPGEIVEYAGAFPPTGWLLCDGQAYSRTAYAALYAVIGTMYGAGDGSTTFNVPDTRGRTSIGAGAGAGLTNRALGGRGGEENHTLSWNEMPVHSHGVNDPGHAHSVYDPTHAHGLSQSPHSHYVNDGGHSHSIGDPGHAHSIYDPTHAHGLADPGHSHSYVNPIGEGLNLPSGFGQSIYNPKGATNTGVSGTGMGVYGSGTGIGIYGASTGVVVYGAATGVWLSAANANLSVNGAPTNIGIYGSGTGIWLGNSGGGAAANVMQPFIAFNKIIRT
jgi:microcystin-dependent protein